MTGNVKNNIKNNNVKEDSVVKKILDTLSGKGMFIFLTSKNGKEVEKRPLATVIDIIDIMDTLEKINTNVKNDDLDGLSEIKEDPKEEEDDENKEGEKLETKEDPENEENEIEEEEEDDDDGVEEKRVELEKKLDEKLMYIRNEGKNLRKELQALHHLEIRSKEDISEDECKKQHKKKYDELEKTYKSDLDESKLNKEDALKSARDALIPIEKYKAQVNEIEKKYEKDVIKVKELFENSKKELDKKYDFEKKSYLERILKKMIGFISKTDEHADDNLRRFLNICSEILIFEPDAGRNHTYTYAVDCKRKRIPYYVYAAISLAIMEMCRTDNDDNNKNSVEDKKNIIDICLKRIDLCLNWFVNLYSEKNDEFVDREYAIKVVVCYTLAVIANVICLKFKAAGIDDNFDTKLLNELLSSHMEGDLINKIMVEIHSLLKTLEKLEVSRLSKTIDEPDEDVIECNFNFFINDIDNTFDDFYGYDEKTKSAAESVFGIHKYLCTSNPSVMKSLVLTALVLSFETSFYQRSLIYNFYEKAIKPDDIDIRYPFYNFEDKLSFYVIEAAKSLRKMFNINFDVWAEDVNVDTGKFGSDPFNNRKDFLFAMQNKVIEMTKKQPEVYINQLNQDKKKYNANTINDAKSSISKVKPCLGEGYTVVFSDTHGDYFSTYGSFVECGYLIPNDEIFLVAFFKDHGKGSGYNLKYEFKKKEEVFDEKNKFRKTLTFMELKSEYDYTLILPGFDINDKFKGTIELLGDFIDRGKESFMCVVLLDYLTKKEREKLKSEYNDDKKLLHLYYGNHDVGHADGSLYGKVRFIKCLLDKMVWDGRMTYSCTRKIGEKCASFSHTQLNKKHIYKLVNIISKFYKISGKKDELSKDNKDKSKGKWQFVLKLNEKFNSFKLLDQYKRIFKTLEANMQENKSVFREYLTRNDIDKEELLKNDDKSCFWFCLGLIVKENLQAGYKLINEKFGFKDEDYFMLRDFIVKVVPYNFYWDNFDCLNELFSDGTECFFECVSPKGAYYWFLFERDFPEKEVVLKGVISLVGHCANKETRNPHFKNQIEKGFDIKKEGYILSVDSGRCYGYTEKSEDELDASYEDYESCENRAKSLWSDSLLLIIDPDGNFMLEGFSLERDYGGRIKDDAKVVPKYCHIAASFDGCEYFLLKKLNSESIKKYGSLKRKLKAFYNVELKKASDVPKLATVSKSIETSKKPI